MAVQGFDVHVTVRWLPHQPPTCPSLHMVLPSYYLVRTFESIFSTCSKYVVYCCSPITVTDCMQETRTFIRYQKCVPFDIYLHHPTFYFNV